MRGRKLPLLAAMLVMTGAIASGALAFDSGGTPLTTGPDQITWTGQGAHDGALDTIQCTGDTPPGTMLWILTVDGGSITNDATTPVLHLGGSGSGAYTTSNPSDNSSAHFVTPYFTPDSNLTASADIYVLDTGTGAWNLTISHGCPGRTAAAGPSVSKDASGRYNDTFTWSLDKSVDRSSVTVKDAPGATPPATVTVNYTIVDSHSAGAVSGVAVSGKITVNNPDSASETLDSITDEIVDGSNAHVANCTVDTSGGLVVSPGDTKYSYSCDLGNSLPSGNVYNKVTIAWSDQDVGTTQHLAAGSAAFTTPSPISFTKNQIDNCETLSDSYSGGPQNQLVCASDDNAGSQTFTYSRNLATPALGSCADYGNTATSTTNTTGTQVSDSANVHVCHYRAPLTIGYWMNHLASSSKTSPNYDSYCAKPLSGTGCSSNGPWTKQYLPKSLGNYSVDTVAKAAAVFVANNCSNASTSSQNAIGCLAAQLLAAKLNIANFADGSCISATIASADAFLVSKNYAGPAVSYTLTSAQRATAVSLANSLNTFNNNGC